MPEEGLLLPEPGSLSGLPQLHGLLTKLRFRLRGLQLRLLYLGFVTRQGGPGLHKGFVLLARFSLQAGVFPIVRLKLAVALVQQAQVVHEVVLQLLQLRLCLQKLVALLRQLLLQLEGALLP